MKLYELFDCNRQIFYLLDGSCSCWISNKYNLTTQMTDFFVNFL